jgi:hypothetical protein
MHDVAKEYSYGTRCSQLLDCCEDEGCPQIKPQLDLNTTRVAAQHTLLRTNLRIHKDHNRYVVKNGKEKHVQKLEVTSSEWNAVAEMEATLSLVSQLTIISQHERAWTGAFYTIVSRRLIMHKPVGRANPAVDLPFGERCGGYRT